MVPLRDSEQLGSPGEPGTEQEDVEGMWTYRESCQGGARKRSPGVEEEQCNPLPFYSSLYPSPPRWFSFCASILSSSASSSFPVLFLLPLLHPSSLSQFLFLSSLSLLSLLSLTESLLPETRNQARVCSNTGLRRYLVEFPFLDNPRN